MCCTFPVTCIYCNTCIYCMVNIFIEHCICTFNLIYLTTKPHYEGNHVFNQTFLKMFYGKSCVLLSLSLQKVKSFLMIILPNSFVFFCTIIYIIIIISSDLCLLVTCKVYHNQYIKYSQSFKF